MATTGGSDIVRNGLVLHYDAATTRSFRGEPTTNLAGSDSARTIQFHSQGAYGNAGTTSEAPEKGPGWKKITITNRGNNFRIAQFPYITNTSGLTYTYSLEVDMATTSGYYWRIDGSGGYGAITIVDGKVQTTISPNTGSFAIFLNHNTTGVSGISEVIYYRYYQVEQKSYATFFTTGTRGTTVATGGGVIDLSGTSNNAEFLNVQYFDSQQGIFSFDGTDDQLIFAESQTLDLLNYTYAFWIKRIAGQSSSWLQFLQRSSSNRNPGMWFYINEINRIHFSIHLSNGNNTSTDPTGFFQNEWHYFTATVRYDGTNTYINGYTDGVLTSSTTLAGVSPITGTGVSWIGRQLMEIANLKIYNRALSAEEILQNFNATRGRFRV